MTRKAKLEKALAYAAFYEGRKLAPLHAVLLEAVEALKCNETFHRLGGIDDCEPCKALAKIDKALEGVGGE